MTIGQAVRAVEALRQSIAGTPDRSFVVKALREQTYIVKQNALKRIQATSLARAVEGTLRPGVRSRALHRVPIRARNLYATVYTQGETSLVCRAYSLAGLIEEGGRTKRHTIEPQGAWGGSLRGKSAGKARGTKALKLPWGWVRRVSHPGSTVHPHNIVRDELERAAPRVEGRLSTLVARRCREVGL